MQLSYLHLNFIRSIPASWDGESLNTVTETEWQCWEGQRQ